MLQAYDSPMTTQQLASLGISQHTSGWPLSLCSSRPVLARRPARPEICSAWAVQQRKKEILAERLGEIYWTCHLTKAREYHSNTKDTQQWTMQELKTKHHSWNTARHWPLQPVLLPNMTSITASAGMLVYNAHTTTLHTALLHRSAAQIRQSLISIVLFYKGLQ